MQPTLSSEAELAYTRGRLHLRRGEQIMPYAMASREDKTPPGADVILSVLSLATVAASKAIGQTGWIEKYRAEMRLALKHFTQAEELAPDFPDTHFRRAQVHRYLGQSEAARISAREAVRLDPDNEDYASFLRLLEPSNRSLTIAPRYSSNNKGTPPSPDRRGMDRGGPDRGGMEGTRDFSNPIQNNNNNSRKGSAEGADKPSCPATQIEPNMGRCDLA